MDKTKKTNNSIDEISIKNPKIELNVNDFIIDKNGYVIGVKSTISKSKKDSIMGYF